MLGQFLEFSVAARPLAASFEFYRVARVSRASPSATRCRIRTSSCSTAPIAIGLHDRDSRSPRLTFVRPQLARLRARRYAGSASSSTHEHLRDDEFNSIGFIGPERPSGRAARGAHVSARRLGPAQRLGLRRVLRTTAAGDSISTRRAASGKRSGSRPSPPARRRIAWQRLDGPRADARACTRRTARPGLSFRCEDLRRALEYLRAKRIARSRAGSAVRRSRAAVSDAERARRHAALSVRERRCSERRGYDAARALTSASASRRRACSGLERGKCVSRYSIWSASTRRPFR